MKKYLLIVLFLISIQLEIVAENQYVRPGRSWSIDWCKQTFHDEFYYFYDTLGVFSFTDKIDIEGKEYYRLHYTPANDENSGGFPESDFCYMRENDGRVYIRLTTDCYLYKFWNYSNEAVSEDTGDIIVFDFNIKEGENIVAPICSPGMDMFDFWIDKNVNLKIHDNRPFIINGEYQNAIHYNCESWLLIDNFLLEGIGPISGFPFMIGGCMAETGSGVYYYVTRSVCDADKEIFNYDNLDYYRYRPFVNEDLTWEYYFEENNVASLVKYKFDGTERVGDVSYGVLKRIHKTEWRKDDNTVISDEDLDEKVALIRDEEGKVWMLNESDTPVDKYCGNNMFETVEGVDRILLYDFTALPESELSAWCEWQGYEPGKDKSFIGNYTVSTQEKADGSHYSLWLYTAELIAGGDSELNKEFKYRPSVGNIGEGTILGPMVNNSDDSAAISRFNNQYFSDGRVACSGAGIESPLAGVSAVNADSPKDNRKWDVLGREIENPLPGTIYIQNGRKFIAR